MLKLDVTLPASLNGSGKIREIDSSRKREIQLAAGEALASLIRNWMSELNSSRSKHGSNFYSPQKVLGPSVNSDGSVTVPINIPGITRALHDIVIRPVNANWLTIPVNEDAHGVPARNYPDLFRPKDKDYLAKNENGQNLVVMYALKKSVTQKQDRSLLPPDEQMNKAVMDAVSGAVSQILRM